MKLSDVEQFIGVKFNEQHMDCADFVAKVRRELFNHDPNLPQSHPRGLRGQRLIGEMSAEYAVRTDHPVDGDLVLMHDGAQPGAGHVGLWFFLDYSPYVLHITEKLQFSVLDKLSAIPDRGLRLEGIYRWK